MSSGWTALHEEFCILKNVITGHLKFTWQYPLIVTFRDPPPKRKGGSGEHSKASHHGLAVAMDSAKS